MEATTAVEITGPMPGNAHQETTVSFLLADLLDLAGKGLNPLIERCRPTAKSIIDIATGEALRDSL
jgi:hypothetical protein